VVAEGEVESGVSASPPGQAGEKKAAASRRTPNQRSTAEHEVKNAI